MRRQDSCLCGAVVAMDPHLLKKLNVERRGRRAVLRILELSTGRDRVVLENDRIAGELGGHVEKAFLSGKSGTVEAEGQSFFLNVHLPPPRILIIGAVHISQALAPMAKIAGFDVLVVDPRSAFATETRFEGCEVVDEWPEDVLADRPLDPFTAVAAVTHDPKIDDLPLISALKTGCFYVGALGSRKTHQKRIERFKDAGVSDTELERIAAPIGLPIGAASPPEIAVAVLAQIIDALRKRPYVAADQAL